MDGKVIVYKLNKKTGGWQPKRYITADIAYRDYGVPESKEFKQGKNVYKYHKVGVVVK